MVRSCKPRSTSSDKISYHVFGQIVDDLEVRHACPVTIKDHAIFDNPFQHSPMPSVATLAKTCTETQGELSQ